jgi:diguanylate cyclase (GGDEF)-like protein
VQHVIDISSSLLTPRQRAWAVAFVVLTLVTTVVLMPFASRQLAFDPTLFASLYSCVFTASAITAFSFGLQHRSSGSFEPGILAIAYGTLTVITPLYTIGLLNGGTLPGTSARGSGWFFFFWHVTFIGCVIAYALNPKRVGRQAQRASGRVMTRRAGVIVLATMIVVIGAECAGFLPPTRVDGHPTVTATIVEYLMIALGVCGLVALYRRSHGRNTLDVWLAVAVVVLISDLVLTAAGGSRASLGWWAARGEHLILALVILSVFLSQTDRTVAQTLRAHSLLAEQAMIDGLTGIANRRKFDRRLADGLAAVADGTSRRLAVAIIDIDRFKFYNDEFGHLAGDETLRLVADALRTALRRDMDFVARYGGEEFAMVLDDTDAEEGRAVCERVRRAVESMRIPHAGVSLLQVVTVSIGITETCPNDNADTLLARADAALYRAKANGRNRVEIETPEQLAGTP